MTVIFPDVVEEYIMNLLIASAIGTPFQIRLYTNNVTPDHDTVLGDLTEAAYTGYSPQPWDPSPVSEVGGKAQFEPANVTFGAVPDDPADVYGFFVTDYTGSNLLMAGRLDVAPYDLHAAALYLHVEWKLYDKNS